MARISSHRRRWKGSASRTLRKAFAKASEISRPVTTLAAGNWFTLETDEHVIVDSDGEKCISAGNIWRVELIRRRPRSDHGPKGDKLNVDKMTDRFGAQAVKTCAVTGPRKSFDIPSAVNEHSISPTARFKFPLRAPGHRRRALRPRESSRID
jgi:hypothetical protein